MYKRHSYGLVILLITAFIIALTNNYQLTMLATQQAVTFTSIVFGFTLTSLSVIHSSNWPAKIVNRPDPEDRSISMLQRLANYFRCCFIIQALNAIFLIIYIDIIERENLPNVPYLELEAQIFLSSIVTAIFIGNCFVTSLLLRLVLQKFSDA